MKFVSLFIGTLLLSVTAFSQLKWKEHKEWNGALPEGFSLFETTDTLDGASNRAFYAKWPAVSSQLVTTLANTEGKRITPSAIFKEFNQPLLVVNATFFSFSTNRSVSLVRYQNQTIANSISVLPHTSVKGTYNYLSRGVFGIDRKGRPNISWVFSDTNLASPLRFEKNPISGSGADSVAIWKQIRKQLPGAQRHPGSYAYPLAIGGGPVLIHNGVIRITNNEERMFAGKGLTDKHPRTAIGYTNKGEIIVLVVEGRNKGIAEGASLQQLAKILLDLGCYEALNLDGGGSSCLLVNGEPTIKVSDKEGQRPIPLALIVQRK